MNAAQHQAAADRLIAIAIYSLGLQSRYLAVSINQILQLTLSSWSDGCV